MIISYTDKNLVDLVHEVRNLYDDITDTRLRVENLVGKLKIMARKVSSLSEALSKKVQEGNS